MSDIELIHPLANVNKRNLKKLTMDDLLTLIEKNISVKFKELIREELEKRKYHTFIAQKYAIDLSQTSEN